jgi:aminoglycoside phosphotransferase (APT) family kinase protein
MTVQRPQGRSLDDARDLLTGWLRTRLPDADELAVANLANPSATGFSSDTLLFDLTWREGGTTHQEALVVRTEPRGTTVFPEYEIAKQYRVMETLRPAGIPLPRTFWLEEDASVLGAPFFVMGRVDGRIPTDSPPYHAGGWVTEISPEERAAIWWSGLETLAAIHRLDPAALGLDFVDTAAAGATPLARQLTYYRDFLAWALHGRPHPLCTQALAWLTDNQPAAPEPVGLCWGDARIGNMIFDGGRCVAVLDWEMVTLGNPEQDLAWYLFLDRHHSEGIDTPRLPGFPSRAETVDRYARQIGRPVRHLHYYEVFAAFRFAVIMIRVGEQLISAGIFPSDSDFAINNTVTPLLARLLEA